MTRLSNTTLLTSAGRTGISLMELIHLPASFLIWFAVSSPPSSPAAFPNSFRCRFIGHAVLAALLLLHSRPSTDTASLAISLSLIGLFTPVPPGDSVSLPEVTHCSSVPCRLQTPWCGG